MTETEYQVKSGVDTMDFDRVVAMLETAYWSKGISKEEVIKGAENSALVVGAFVDGEQIAYARAISDKTRFGYVCDVFVDERFRKRGIGQALVKAIMSHPDLEDVYQWLLITGDAYGVYEKCGFHPLDRPNDWMEIRKMRNR